MKKHPVDDLFKRKLGGLEKRPSEDAWLKIQAKSKPKRQRIGWLWYAAASLTIGLFGGYLLWQNDRADLDNPIGNKVIAKVESTEPPTQSIEVEGIPKSKDASSQSNVPKEIRLPDNDLVNHSPQSKKDRKRKAEYVSDQVRISIEVIEKPAAVVSQNALVEASSLPKVTEYNTHKSEPPVTEIVKPEAEPARTIVVAVESEFIETDDRPKTSRFSRVFRQLKNARAGEKVDWEEVGFNPKTLVARVDDRLRSKDDKAPENQNPKDRTKL